MHRPRQHFTFFVIASYVDSIYAGNIKSKQYEYIK